MINGIEAQFEGVVTLTTNIETNDGYFYAGGEVGGLVKRGYGDDPTLLVKFAGRPAICVTPGDDCVIGDLAVA